MNNNSIMKEKSRTLFLKMIIPRISSDIGISLLVFLVSITIGIGSSLLANLLGDDFFLPKLQTWWKAFYDFMQGNNIIIPMTVVVIISTTLSAIKVFMNYMEISKKRSSDDQE